MRYSTRSQMLADERIGPLLTRLSLPAIVSMMVQALYNVVDTIFIGQWVGTMGISAITVVLPIHMLMMAVGQTIGVGGASIISRRMGAGDNDAAALTLGNMVLLAVLFGGAFAVFGFFFMVPLLNLFGVTPDTMALTIDYFEIILIACPIIILTQSISNAVRAEGNANVAMYTMLIGTVVNIGLDPLFIFGLGMGIRGAAIATLISISVTGLGLAIYFIAGRSEVAVGWRFLRFNKKLIKEMLAIGASGFAHGGAMSVTTTIIVNSLGHYGGAVAIATFGVMFRMLTFIFMPLMGLTQGLQPIVGFNYGAQQYDRVRAGIKLAAIASVSISTIGFVFVLLFPDLIIRLFADDAQLLASGRNALRFAVAALPLAGFQIIGSGIFQSLGKALQALVLTLSRQVLVLIPLVLIMPRIFGLNGVWMAFPVSDFLTFTITLLFVYRVMKSIPKSSSASIQAGNEAR